MSMRYLLDTNVCVAMLRNQYGVRARIQNAGFDNCAVSEITIAELFYGAAKSGHQKHIQEVFDVMRLFQVLPISDCLELYGNIKNQLECTGMRIDDFDLLIGATAVQYGMTMITHNTKHFLRIPNIALEDWETSAK